MLPFTVERFLGVFEAYNAEIWPAQVGAYVLGLVAVALAFRPMPGSGRIIAAILAALWLAMGALYHIRHFASINPAAYAFGALFIAQAALLGYGGVIRGGLSFRIGPSWRAILGMAMILYALVGYGLLAPLFGHLYPRVPVFGVAPCPTTIFTLGMLLLTPGRPPTRLLLIPLVWAAIGGSAAVLLGVPEDFGLIAAGLLTVGAVLRGGPGEPAVRRA